MIYRCNYDHLIYLVYHLHLPLRFYLQELMSKRPRPQSLQKEEKDIQDTLKEQTKKQVQTTLFSAPKKQQLKIIGNFSNYDPAKQKALPRQFFRQQVVTLAEALLGKIFVRETKQGTIKAVIVETEAYKAPLDKGCHAYNNKKTDRTKYFWLDGGHLYIYTIYMPTNICLNVVAGLQGQPQAVLIRGVQPIEGIDLIKKLRNIKSNKIEDLCNGPGKIGMSLAIDKEKMNGIDLIDGYFKIVDADFKNFQVSTSKRINIDYAEEWRFKPWRFYVEGNSFVSKADPQKPAKKKK